MSQDFSTIEHDFLHMKDYFSNYKFTYKERRSKLDFLQNITNEPAQDTSILIASSKEQLVAVKNVYKKADLEIKKASSEISVEEEKSNENRRILEDLIFQENALKEELNNLMEFNESILEHSKVAEECDKIENEIKNAFLEFEGLKSTFDSSRIETMKKEEKEAREERNDLAAKQRRLTIINTDNYMEDIYFWNRGILDILEKVFGNISVNSVGEKFVIKILKNESFVEMTVKDKKLTESYLKCQNAELQGDFEVIKRYSQLISDIRPILIFFSIKC